ncbi:MAG: nuclear transport factor 2 family protein [Dechloromonas sp.]|nr:nuclear transport factor 2 family protein [Dechloromonas sp.]
MPQALSFASPEDLEAAFYDAIAHGDADLLMQFWADDEQIVCVHPTGVQLTGLAPIRDSWLSIFRSTRLRVQARSIAHWHGTIMAVHHLTETLFVGADPSPHGPLHVTHVYLRGPQGWRLISRHASAADNSHQAMAEAVPHTLH